ncbi:cAMP-binding domain of CRP or a regulatory subunit of cAMP-dependent protein kinases [Actinokineospora terrae]|uniref:cAMP-binding domain of CRP or a regulatory subunit of cAMP-dependent protein kinases n=1 Tax=Actinokineospora terrae TaxID=155974 RepID=A0A1H9WSM2_9PSEU|nr:cAMP-binding domain of CRP or a regulatory subunit of cAMP-dependent protein kinases [Actinokineospora terrae]
MQTFQALVGARLWAAVVAAGTAREYARGAVLLRQGEPGGQVLALLRGRVRVMVSDVSGAQLLVSLRGPGDLVGELAPEAGVTRTASVVALDRCTVAVLGAAVLDGVLAGGARGAVREYLRIKLVAMVGAVPVVHLSSGARVARLLLEVIDRAEGSDRRVPLSQEAVAEALGMARSTVAEQIAELRRCGALGRGPRLVVVDRSELARRAGLSIG